MRIGGISQIGGGGGGGLNDYAPEAREPLHGDARRHCMLESARTRPLTEQC